MSSKKFLECPAPLSPEARAEWERLVPELMRLRLITAADRAALALYCESWSQWTEATARLASGKLVRLEPGAPPVPNPYLAIARAAAEQMTRLLAELGLTPASRLRLTARASDHGTGDDWFARVQPGEKSLCSEDASARPMPSSGCAEPPSPAG